MAVRTREQEREHKRAQRERQRTEQSQALASVSQMRPTDDDESPGLDIPGPGEFERKVIAELEGLGEVASKRMPGQAGNAIAMARILDNPMAIMQHAGASGQLRAALLALHEAAKTATRTTGKVRMLRDRHVG